MNESASLCSRSFLWTFAWGCYVFEASLRKLLIWLEAKCCDCYPALSRFSNSRNIVNATILLRFAFLDMTCSRERFNTVTFNVPNHRSIAWDNSHRKTLCGLNLKFYDKTIFYFCITKAASNYTQINIWALGGIFFATYSLQATWYWF